jgi:hypothetical protein
VRGCAAVDAGILAAGSCWPCVAALLLRTGDRLLLPGGAGHARLRCWEPAADCFMDVRCGRGRLPTREVRRTGSARELQSIGQGGAVAICS